MAKMGRYCKVYLAGEMRAFGGWSENSGNVRPETKEENGREVTVERTLTDDDLLYLQENYVVTDGIFMDEHVIFDQVTPEWVDYCKQTLQFELPDYLPPQQEEEASASAAGGNGQE